MMKYFGKYSTFEVDNMYPFEREIYHGLLLDTKKKIKDKQKHSGQ